MMYNLVEKRFELCELVEETTQTVNEQYYQNCCGAETLRWFRNLGGKETLRHKGNKHILTSYSPNRQVKVIREFTELV